MQAVDECLEVSALTSQYKCADSGSWSATSIFGSPEAIQRNLSRWLDVLSEEGQPALWLCQNSMPIWKMGSLGS